MFEYNLYRLCYELNIRKHKIHKILIDQKLMNKNLIALDDKLKVKYKRVMNSDGSIDIKNRLLVDFITYCEIRSKLISGKK